MSGVFVRKSGRMNFCYGSSGSRSLREPSCSWPVWPRWQGRSGIFQGLPDYSQLQNYEPPVMTRVHAADDRCSANTPRSAGCMPIQRCQLRSTPRAAEDKNFYEHGGVDAIIAGARGVAHPELRFQPPPQGARDHPAGRQELPLTNEVSFSGQRKPCWRCESSGPIPGTRSSAYLNEIIRPRAYGIAAASLFISTSRSTN